MSPAKTGIAIRYESMRGNLFSGGFSFGEVSVIQDDPTRARLAIEAHAVEANLSLAGLLFGRRALDAAAARGASVRFETPTSEATDETDQQSNDRGSPRIPKFEIRRLDLQDIAISVVDRSRADAVTYGPSCTPSHTIAPPASASPDDVSISTRQEMSAAVKERR